MAALLIVGLFVFLLAVQDYRLMSALQVADPELYREYGGHLFVGPRKLRMLVRDISFGGYQRRISDPTAQTLAAQYRVLWLGYLVVLVIVFTLLM